MSEIPAAADETPHEEPSASVASPEPPTTEPAATDPPPRGPSMINIRNLSVRCGRCNQYQVLVGFAQLDEDWNLYTYECDGEPCASDPTLTRTLLEVPSDLDEFARRNPRWHGGKKHAGADHGVGHS